MNTIHPRFRPVKSTHWLLRMIIPFVVAGLFLPNLWLPAILGLGRVFASVPVVLSRSMPAQMMGELHIVHIPFFTGSEGMTSILTLNNNMTEMATATVTLYNMKGQPLVLPTVRLAPQLPVRFDLSQLANQPDFESGNVQIAFNGMSMGITSQVSVISTARRVAFESVEDEAMDFTSSRLDGILWLPDSDTQARLALTNTTASPVTATVSLAGDGEQRKVILGPHETQLVEANGFIESARGPSASGVLVSIQHDASPGSVMVTGFAVNDETGFSTNFPFVDRTTLVST